MSPTVVLYFHSSMAKKAKVSRTTKRKKPPVKLAKREAPRSKASDVHKAGGTDPKRVTKILEKLDEAYPAATCALTHDNPFQLLISTILSAQCTDERVNQVTATLFPKYPTPEAFA